MPEVVESRLGVVVSAAEAEGEVVFLGAGAREEFAEGGVFVGGDDGAGFVGVAGDVAARVVEGEVGNRSAGHGGAAAGRVFLDFQQAAHTCGAVQGAGDVGAPGVGAQEFAGGVEFGEEFITTIPGEADFALEFPAAGAAVQGGVPGVDFFHGAAAHEVVGEFEFTFFQGGFHGGAAGFEGAQVGGVGGFADAQAGGGDGVEVEGD